MEWLKHTETTVVRYVLVKTNDWNCSTNIRLADVTYVIHLGLFGNEIKSRTSVADSIKSTLWNIILQQTASFVPGDEIKKTFTTESTFHFEMNKNSHEICLASTKHLDIDMDNLDPGAAVTIQFELTIIESFGLDNLSSSVVGDRLNASSDIALLVENKEIRVNKGLLSSLSCYFYSLFNGDYKEKDADKIELKEVSYEEVSEFMRIVHGIHNNINEHNYVYLLALSDRFQVPSIKRMCEEYMLTLKNFYVNGNFSERMAALLLSEKYQLPKIQNIVVKSMNTLTDLKSVVTRKEFLDLPSKARAYVLQYSITCIEDGPKEYKCRCGKLTNTLFCGSCRQTSTIP